MTMINKETIISAFDEKLTLLQWLKTLEKALEDAVVEGFSLVNDDATHVHFLITFTDGTSVTSNVIELPQGPQGEQGPQGPQGPAGTDGTKLYLHQLDINGFDDTGDPNNKIIYAISTHSRSLSMTIPQNTLYSQLGDALTQIDIISIFISIEGGRAPVSIWLSTDEQEIYFAYFDSESTSPHYFNTTGGQTIVTDVVTTL